jgi:hypothetical protein
LNISNLLSTDYNALDKNVSNYVLVSNNNTSIYASDLIAGMSNYLTASISTTSNELFSHISLLTTDNIVQGTQNKYITNNTYSGQLNINSAVDNQSLLNITAAQNNTPDSEIINIKKGTTDLFKMISNGFIGVRMGTNLPTVALDVDGDIKFTGKVNDITVNELNNLKNINYNIKQRIDTNDSNQSNYISAVNTNISERIDTNDSNQSNYISAVNTNISERIDTNDSNQSNYISAVNTNISERIDTNDSNQSNYISAVNTNISERITNITTDTITQGLQKKFIINDIYDGNLIINSNLTVHGSTTTLNTDVYTTERLDITNINQENSALTVRQTGESKNIINAFKNGESDSVFSVNTSGNVEVKGNISFVGDLFKGAEKFKASNWTSNIDGIMTYSNVAIGKTVTTNSVYKLDVDGNMNVNGNISFVGDLFKGTEKFKASNWTSNIDGIMSYSNVAIGKTVTTNSAYKFDVNGNMYVNGNIIASLAITTFDDFSDERLKDREGNIENPLDIVNKLQGFYYKPNKIATDLGIKGNKMNKRELGISAQDVQKILPELIDIAPVDISYDAENNVISKTGSNYLTVNYEKIIPLLIESIKELSKNINELKKDNVELRDLIKSQ